MCAATLVGCAETGTDGLTAAKDYLHAMYKDESTVTPNDIVRASVIKVGADTYNVTWTVNVKSGSAEDVKVVVNDNGTVTIDVNEQAAADVAYELTATITDANGKTITDTFNYTLPAFKELTWEEYMAAETDESVIVKGVITALIAKSQGNSSNGFYMQDNDGGYYIYGLATDPITENGLKVGMTVRVSGKKDIYNGTHEVKDATVEILDSNIATVEPVDFTAIYTGAETLKDDALAGKQALLVTVKGVTITTQVESSGYYKFKLGELESYVRISSSVCPLTADDQAALKAAHTAGAGAIADVTGIISVYDGAFYLTPATKDAFSNISMPDRNDEEKIDFEAGSITVPEEVKEDTTVALKVTGATYDNVSFAWTSDNAAAVIAEDGTLTLTLQDEAVTVTITGTATCGEATKTVTYTVKLAAKPKFSFTAEFVGAPEAGTAYKFALVQGNLEKTLFFTGEMDGYYLAMSEDGDKAVDVYLEAVEGGFRFYFMKGDVKNYFEIYEYQEGKGGVQITTEPSSVFVYNEDAKTYTVKIGEDDFYLGTYKTYSTISASSTYYITGENAANVGVSQFLAGFCTVTKTEA